MSQTPNEMTSAPASAGEGSLLGGDAAGSVNDTLMGSTTTVDAAPGAGTSDPAPAADAPAAAPVVGLAPLPDNASEDQKRDFNNKLRAYNGVPDAPDKYGDFGFGDKVKIDTKGEDYQYYTGVFHELGLNKDQAKTLLEKHTEFANRQIEQHQQKNEKAITDYRAKVKNDFIAAQGGEAAYEVFRSTAEQGFKATAKGAGMNDGEIKGLLNIMGDDPRFVKMFNHIGKNFQEAVLISGATPSAPEPSWENKFEGMFGKTS